jgi:small-conductance mechanosensitive channel
MPQSNVFDSLATLMEHVSAWFAPLHRVFPGIPWMGIFSSSLLLIVCWPLIFVLTRLIRTKVSERYSPQHGLIASKLFFHGSFALVTLMIISQFPGIRLAPLLGTAGVIGVAVGFASQTSFSNIISGFFLVFEKPFVIDDVIEVNGITGQVVSIDMISVKLRTSDNKLVRIPNETMIKSAVTNQTYYPIVRSDIALSIRHEENFGRVRELLLDIARRNPLCLVEPGPVVAFSGYGTSAVDLLFSVWSTRSDGLQLKNTMQEEIKLRFDAEGVEIPYPHMTLMGGGARGVLEIAAEATAEKPAEKAQDKV